jgi:hypothetical protein
MLMMISNLKTLIRANSMLKMKSVLNLKSIKKNFTFVRVKTGLYLKYSIT